MNHSSPRITLQGLPTAIELLGMSLTTTLPAPIVVFEPIVTPGQMIAPPPIQTLFPILMGAANSLPVSRSAGSASSSNFPLFLGMNCQ